MQYIIVSLFGMFIGFAIAGYMFVNEINRKERKIANQEAKIKNRDDLIEYQRNQITLIKNAVNKRYYAVETLENEIKSILSSNKNGNRK